MAPRINGLIVGNGLVICCCMLKVWTGISVIQNEVWLNQYMYQEITGPLTVFIKCWFL